MYNLIKTTLFFAIVVFGVACDGKVKEENEKLRLQNEELVAAAKKDSMYISSMSSEMDRVYYELDSLRAMEQRIRETANRMRGGDVNATEGGLSIDETFAQIEKKLASSQQKIADLNRKLGEANKENAILKKALDELNKTIQDKDKYIGELKVYISDLEGQVEGWKSKYSVTASQKDSIKQALDITEDALSIAYYAIGTGKDLENRGIIARKGIFKGKIAGLAPTISNDKLTKIDVRKQTEIEVGNKEIVQIVPERNSSTYEIKQGKIVIKDTNKFWENKYLAVVVK